MSASVLDLTPQVTTFSQYPYSNRSSWPGPALPQRSDPARGQRPGSARVRSVLRPLRRRRRVGCLSRSLQGGYAHTLNPRHRWMRIEREAPSGTSYQSHFYPTHPQLLSCNGIQDLEHSRRAAARRCSRCSIQAHRGAEGDAARRRRLAHWHELQDRLRPAQVRGLRHPQGGWAVPPSRRRCESNSS